VPLQFIEVTLIVPWCIVIILWASESPIPDPLKVNTLLALKNG
jgi:hypothetical protein